jgi:DUF1009 family protein
MQCWILRGRNIIAIETAEILTRMPRRGSQVSKIALKKGVRVAFCKVQRKK